MESLDKLRDVSTVNGTDDREALLKHWYVALVQMNCEKTVEKKLQAVGFQTFLPVQTEIHRWSDRKKKIDRIVIPMMLFVKLSSEEIKKVRNFSFVYKLLTAPGESVPAVIPEEQIDQFKFMLGNSDSEITIEPLTVQKGDKVRVRRGSLRGLTGYAGNSSDGKSKILVVIDYLGCACVSISLNDLESIE
ncbi:UpxY family transcription antiterminator [Phocaeicola sp.]